MRILVFSDLHLEHGIDDPMPCAGPGHDVAVVCGDVHAPPARAVSALAAMPLLAGSPVLYLPGNHEYYGGVVDDLEREPPGTAGTNVVWMHRRTYLAGDVRFVGAVLWTDYDLYGNRAKAMRDLRYGLNDHSHVGVRRGPAAAPDPDRVRLPFEGVDRFMPADALRRHREDLAYVEKVLATPFEGRTVVMTHHAPHPGSIEPRYVGSSLNPGFASDLTRTIERYGPDLWVHGHVHSRHDYRVGRTRVVANPRGYERHGVMENPGFEPLAVIEI